MKIALVFPNSSISSPQKSPPLAILHVGRALSEAKARGKSDEDYEVSYYDLRYQDMTPDDFKNADVVGVSSMTGVQLRGAIDTLKKAKQYGKRTILGGIHSTMQPEQCISEDYVDSIVTSEGEWGIIEAIHGGHKQIVHGHLKDTSDHVSPVSPETLIHFKRSARTGDSALMTSRGCPFRCAFCYVQMFYNRSWQSVDMDRWKHDIIYLRDNAGVVKLEHSDDWVGKWDRAREIIKFLQQSGVEYRPSIRAHQVDDEVAREMAEMGIKHISVGMETASLRMLKLTEKDILPKHQIICAEALAKYKIHPMFYWITGFATETQAEINETLDQVDRIAKIFKGYGTPLTQNLFAYIPLPGSPMYDLVDKDTMPKNMEDWSNYAFNRTQNKQASSLYWIGGLTFHREKGDKTDRNFPGWKRWLIYPFEWLSSFRWKHRWFTHFEFEQWAIDYLMRWASLRYENSIRKTKRKVKDMEAMDFGVVENQVDIGARGEFMTDSIKPK